MDTSLPALCSKGGRMRSDKKKAKKAPKKTSKAKKPVARKRSVPTTVDPLHAVYEAQLDALKTREAELHARLKQYVTRDEAWKSADSMQPPEWFEAAHALVYGPRDPADAVRLQAHELLTNASARLKSLGEALAESERRREELEKDIVRANEAEKAAVSTAEAAGRVLAKANEQVEAERLRRSVAYSAVDQMRQALERVVTEVTKPIDKFEQPWTANIAEPSHFIQQALAEARALPAV